MCDKTEAMRLERTQRLYDQLVAKHPECPGFWKWFCSVSEVPRPSGHMEKVKAWAREAGRMVGGVVKVDQVGNVHVRIPATKGLEASPGVVIQAHLDMVPTSRADVKHDFVNEPIHAWVDGDVIRARGTTLGADDGSGIAAALALAEDKNVRHGPLELLFTVDEEIGLIGACKMVPGELLGRDAKYLLNVDCDRFAEICVSSAGGVNRKLVVPVKRAPLEGGVKWSVWEMEIHGLKGGHTGCEIHVGRANAIKWACKVLADNAEAQSGAFYRLLDLKGGNAHNAIPSRCIAEVAVPEDRANAFFVAASDVFHGLVQGWSHVEKCAGQEPQFRLRRLEADKATKDPLTWSSTRSALRFLEAVHHGVWKYSEEIPTLVESSQSCSTVKLHENEVELEVYARSSSDTALEAFPRVLEDLAALYGGRAVQEVEDAPGWPAAPSSRLCNLAAEVLKDEFNEEAKILPVHAGLECGTIIAKEKSLGLEAISVGATVCGAHTPEESMDLESAAKLYKFLARLLERLAEN